MIKTGGLVEEMGPWPADFQEEGGCMCPALQLECGMWGVGRGRVPIWKCSRGSVCDSEGLAYAMMRREAT